MSTSTILVGGGDVTLVAMPASPSARSVEFSFSDAVAAVPSVFTGQVQTTVWPGGERWTGVITLPPLSRADAANWIAFILQCRGIQNAFQVGDPLWRSPLGQPYGSQPVVDNSQNNGNPAMSDSIGTQGWVPNVQGLLLPGDYIQVGWRLHRVLDSVDSDSSGKALVKLWPTLREAGINGLGLLTGAPDGGGNLTPQPAGLFRLASNERKFSFDITRLTRMSIPIQEWR